ncbi:MAG: aldo/keto reductase [Muribaculaceae bacterium]|nr:aldo/keto reductase [Muribaculaceae bacterium]
MERREFLKRLGIGAAATSAVVAACTGKKEITSSSTRKATGPMTMRRNPATGDEVSLLGYGMMRLPVIGGGTDRDHPDAEIDQEMVNRQVDYALEHGVNYFDTSPAYCQGRSETATGIALSRHKRSEYFIATKLSNFSANTWSRHASQEMFHTSLKNLKVNYVDYLLLHAIGMGNTTADGKHINGMEAFEERYMKNGILDWLVEQKHAGKIRNLGFSYHGDVEVFNLMLKWHDEGRYHWDFVQIELNYLDWWWADEINPRNTDAKYLYEELAKRNIPAVIMEPLLGGRLANVPDPSVARMKARRPEDSVAAWAFRYAGTFDKVLTVLSGMTYMENLVENCITYSSLEPITKEENDLLMDISNEIYNLKTIPCNECNYCMPCPYGLNIPAIFSHYNKCIKDGNIPNDHKDPEYARQRRAFLIGYDRSVPRLRQASHCIGCGQCSPHCPQRIDIPNEMRKIDVFVEGLKRNDHPHPDGKPEGTTKP